VASTEPKDYPLKQLYFYLTRGCNLRCRHCWIAPKYQSKNAASSPSLPLDLFKLIIEQAKPLGLSSVKLTGGEPLLHPELFKIVEVIRDHDLRLNVETNGVLCNRALARNLAACKNPFVSVSLDGVDADTHDWVRGVKGAFQSSIAGIRNLVEAGLSPQIIMTIMRANVHQMESMALLAEDIGAGSVKFNIVQPTARGETLHRMDETLPISKLIQLGQWAETTLCAQTHVKIIYSHPLSFRPLGKLIGTNNGDGCRVCGITGILGVLADGSYALCGIGESVPEFVFGNARDDHLRNVWNQNSILKDIRGGFSEKLEGVCSRCLMNRLCMGHCIAQNYYSKGRIYAPYWYCEKAMESDLFPTTRHR